MLVDELGSAPITISKDSSNEPMNETRDDTVCKGLTDRIQREMRIMISSDVISSNQP